MRSLTVLVVEDNDMNRALFRAVLQRAGHRVLEAADIDEARRNLNAGPVDLVLLDVRVPGGGGLVLLSEIRAEPRWAGMTVVAVTAQAMAGDREQLLKTGFDGYIPKPISTKTFAAEVEAFLKPELGAGEEEQEGVNRKP